jgi:TatD DNase family protein
VLVDAHCHLGDRAFDEDRAAALERARAAGVGHVVVIGDSLEGSARAAALAAGRAGLSASAGVHPHVASTWGAEVEGEIRALLARPEVVAAGETGLDYHYDHSPRAAQRAAFEAQLSLAAEIGRPVVVHARDADDDVAGLVREWGPRVPALVLHSFSSGAAVFDAGMAVGAYFSFSGMITFRSWTMADRLTAVPADRLLIETDSPYLAPVPHRGRRNEPAFVREVAAALARARGDTLERMTTLTTANAGRAFGARVATILE